MMESSFNKFVEEKRSTYVWLKELGGLNESMPLTFLDEKNNSKEEGIDTTIVNFHFETPFKLYSKAVNTVAKL